MPIPDQREAVDNACALTVAPWLPGWTWRHGLLTALGAVLGWLFYSGLAVNLPGLGWTVVVLILSATAGRVVASYLPREGTRLALPRDVCGYAPILMLLVAGWFLTISTGSLWSAPPAVLIAGLAVLRRTAGSSTCSV
ncbi:hypothetical protein GA707_07345 [Nostocoides sp. F2B08]|uniref:hypothetical protein n=1 Tax=Nostocoides sp. F2B08 TaxID=2653936 RepID=UPI0012636EEE|nr:hypothetical protein [Tetrasphaera sp. F2B08]KAB7745708.1 hypothetical protein GA707_07345 [Tetrasphaera sp. F2B08]